MPTYQYACTECDHRLEAVQSFSDAALTECPVCGGRLRKVFSAVGVVFKGSGFYKNDSRSGGTGGEKASGGESRTGDAATAGKGDGGKSEAGGKGDGAKAGKSESSAGSSGSSSGSSGSSSGSSGSGSSGGGSSGSGSSGGSGSGSGSGRSGSTPAKTT